MKIGYDNGVTVSIDCIAVENRIPRNMYECSEPDCRICNDPPEYVKGIFSCLFPVFSRGCAIIVAFLELSLYNIFIIRNKNTAHLIPWISEDKRHENALAAEPGGHPVQDSLP